MLTDAERAMIEELREAESKSTPGAWVPEHEESDDMKIWAGERDAKGYWKTEVVGGCGCCSSPRGDNATADADFIVAARNSIPSLLTLIERLEGENQEFSRKVNVLDSFARDCRDNFDCDADAHRYGTSCRSCVAAVAIRMAFGDPETRP